MNRQRELVSLVRLHGKTNLAEELARIGGRENYRSVRLQTGDGLFVGLQCHDVVQAVLPRRSWGFYGTFRVLRSQFERNLQTQLAGHFRSIHRQTKSNESRGENRG